VVLQERGELLPAEDSLDISRKVKEMYCYTCSDIVKVNPFALLLSIGLHKLICLMEVEFSLMNLNLHVKYVPCVKTTLNLDCYSVFVCFA